MRLISLFALLTAAVLVAAFAFAGGEETVDVTVRMSRAKFEECSRNGGCAFLSPAEVMWAYQKGVEDGIKAYKEDHLDFHGCTKDDA